MNEKQSRRLEELTEQRAAAVARGGTTLSRWNRSDAAMEYAKLLTQKQNEEAVPQSKRPARDWRGDRATEAQLRYLVSLGIELEDGMTKGRASDLIEAHKRGEGVGMVGGFYHDGSN